MNVISSDIFILFFFHLQTSVNEVLIRSFQLAFSLRNISLKEGVCFPLYYRHIFYFVQSLIGLSKVLCLLMTIWN